MAVQYNTSTGQTHPWILTPRKFYGMFSVEKLCLFSSRLWCVHVMVTPEASRIAVFSNGTCV